MTVPRGHGQYRAEWKCDMMWSEQDPSECVWRAGCGGEGMWETTTMRRTGGGLYGLGRSNGQGGGAGCKEQILGDSEGRATETG